MIIDISREKQYFPITVTLFLYVDMDVFHSLNFKHKIILSPIGVAMAFKIILYNNNELITFGGLLHLFTFVFYSP